MRKFLIGVFLFFVLFDGTKASAGDIDAYFFHFDEVTATQTYRNATHVFLTPDRVLAGDAGTNDITVTLYWQMFCPEIQQVPPVPCAEDLNFPNLRADLKDPNAPTQLGLLTSMLIALKPYKDQIKMWHIVDEPYLAATSLPKTTIEEAATRLFWISQAHGYSADIPRWVNFAKNCFKSSGYDASCAKPTVNTADYAGIPGSTSLHSFDWYAADTGANTCGTPSFLNNHCHIDTHMTTYVVPTLAALKAAMVTALNPTDIMLVPGTFSGIALDGSGNVITGHLASIGANEVLARYTDLALSDSRITGLVPFTYRDPQPSAHVWEALDVLDATNGGQGEMFYQAIGLSQVNGLKDLSFIPVFEYNDDEEYDLNSVAISPADSHYYTAGYEGAEIPMVTTPAENYGVRRLAFYMKATYTNSAPGYYTKQIFRCVILRSNGRYGVFFAPTSSCNSVPGATASGSGYVAATSNSEADHKIIQCISSALPYWDMAYTLLAAGQSGASECTKVFGSGYSYWADLGYSKKM